MYGVDLHALYQQRRVVLALDLIDGLPAASRLRQAVLNDPDAAAALVDQQEADERAGKNAGEWAPDVSEYDANVIMQGRILAALSDIAQTLTAQASGGKSKGKPIRIPTPKTAVEQERDRRHVAKGRDLMKIFTPHDVG